MFGLGWPEWLTIIGLVGGLILTFRVMARAAIRYEAARRAGEQREAAGHEAGKEEER